MLNRTFRNWILCLLLVSGLIRTARSQIEVIPFAAYLKTDGLPGATVPAMLEDSLGFIWVGTNRGLAKFDGFAFSRVRPNSALRDAWISQLYKDRLGHIWVCSSKGLYQLDQQREVFLPKAFND
ncbi:MAG: two-component regulator propeller domain-containing protein, partial [Bacteroidota bacterium]